MVFPAPRRQIVNGPALDTVEASVAYCPTGYRQGGITADGVTKAAGTWLKEKDRVVALVTPKKDAPTQGRIVDVKRGGK